MTRSGIIVLLFLMWWSPVFSMAAAETEVTVIKDREEMVVGMLKGDHYPYYFTNAKGKLDGLDVDLAQLLTQRLGVDLKIDRSAETPDELFEKVLNNEVDVVAAGTKVLLSDALRVCFTEPYLTVEYALIINRLNLAELMKPGDSFGILQSSCARIGVIDKPHYIEYASRLFPKAKIVPLPSLAAVIEETESRRLTAGFADEVEAKTVFMLDPALGLTLKYVQVSKQRDDLGLVTSWRHRHLRAWLNLFLQNNPVNLNVDQLLNRYPLP